MSAPAWESIRDTPASSFLSVTRRWRVENEFPRQRVGTRKTIPRSQTPFGNAFLDAPRRMFTKHNGYQLFLTGNAERCGRHSQMEFGNEKIILFIFIIRVILFRHYVLSLYFLNFTIRHYLFKFVYFFLSEWIATVIQFLQIRQCV